MFILTQIKGDVMSFQEFWYQFYRKYIGWGTYQTEELDVSQFQRGYGVGSWYHVLISTLIIIFISFYLYRTREYDSDKLYKSQRKISITMLVLEALRFLWYRIYQGFWYFKFDYCNMVCLFMPVLILMDLKKLWPFLMSIAFWGGTAVLFYPYGVFASLGGLHIVTVQSLVSHGLMALSSFNLARIHKINNLKKDFLVSALGFSVMFVISLVMSYVNNANYMALRDPSGMPLVSLLPFPLHMFAIAGIILLGLYLFLLVCKKCENKILCYDLKDNLKKEGSIYNEV